MVSFCIHRSRMCADGLSFLHLSFTNMYRRSFLSATSSLSFCTSAQCYHPIAPPQKHPTAWNESQGPPQKRPKPWDKSTATPQKRPKAWDVSGKHPFAQKSCSSCLTKTGLGYGENNEKATLHRICLLTSLLSRR